MLSISTSSAHSQLSVLVVDTQKRDGVDMAKMTKTQIRRSLQAIKSKARKLFVIDDKVVLRTNDIVAIDKIIDAALKRMK